MSTAYPGKNSGESKKVTKVTETAPAETAAGTTAATATATREKATATSGSPFTHISSSRKTMNSFMGGLMWVAMILALIPLCLLYTSDAADE